MNSWHFQGLAREADGNHVRRSGTMENRTLRDVGGTPGGIGEFVVGFVMTCVGGYLLSNQVSIVGSYWSFYGANTFGVTLIPMLLGIALVFFNGKRVIGWVLTAGGFLF